MTARRRFGTREAFTRAPHLLAIALAALLGSALTAHAQIGQLVSPGPLSRAHQKLEGAANCQKCHTPGRKVTADLCLSCHKPVAERIAQKKGVHRKVTNDCTSCHVEHNGADEELRPFDKSKFDHEAETGFKIDGLHAPFAKDCARCHKTRSFLAASPTCVSCHQDVHKPTLGTTCTTCHSTSVGFKQTQQQYDHTKAAFQLTGAHQKVACEKCHVNKVFKGLKFEQCTDCHKSPHRQTVSGVCTTCHTTESWKTQKFDHARTQFPLKGKHAEVACATCHKQSPVKVALKFDRCATCHTDVHKGEFKQDCASCHNEQGFTKPPFDHTKATKFPLTGEHTKLTCDKCHKGVGPPKPTPVRAAPARAALAKTVDFRGLQTTCVSCHKDVHRAELGAACDSCHTSATFKLPGYKHPRFPEFFAGQHATVACASCHIAQVPGTPKRTAASIDAWKFKNLPTACATCHTDVHLGQVGTACETCHSIDTAKFAASKFSHAKASFQLTGKHEKVECRKCHKEETASFPAGRGTAIRLKGVGTTCVSCHQDQHIGQLGNKCETCHSTGTFKLPAYTHTAVLKPFFVGKHATEPCASCHKLQEGSFPAGRGQAVRYKGMGTTCTSCHADAHRGALGKNCETCHTPEVWKTISRAFHKAGVFPLEGRHLTVECAACHLQGVVQGTPTRCYDCHWVRRHDDRYQTRLGVECEKCHRPISWSATNWNHGTMTGMALSPAHKSLGCEGCHTNQNFLPGSVTCYTCHAQDYQRAQNPNHQSAGFPTTCEACHTPAQTSWSQARFDHNAAFPLAGVHATQPCAACHRDGIYKGTPRDCVGCHKANYDKTTNPNHASAGFPTACESCHRFTDLNWNQPNFNHNTFFQLVGVHATQPCATCHKNNLYKGTARDCVGCHKANYDQTRNPNHAAAGFPTACESCHRPSDQTWTAKFDHNLVYPLVGVHATQQCETCHKNGVYKGTPRDCVGCHRANYDQTRNPNHASAGFPTTCEQCHQPSAASWTGRFDHNLVFPLVGTHATQQCTTCHKNGTYQGTPRDCVGCHKTDYDKTANPNHASAGFPTTCEQCHNPSLPNWQGAFNHSQFFPLVGTHAVQACAACHKNNVYKGTPRDCVGCHKTDYDKTTNPNHVAAGFPTACESCHNATSPSWNSSFDHSRFFPLQGTHATQQCAACHKNNVYKGTPRDCYGCHKTDYDQTTNPNHAAAGFPTACEQCHTATAPDWHTSFNHSQFFPLVGTHATQQCTACHKNGVYKGTPRDCYGCHKTDYDRTTDPNHAAAGFPTACESCHNPAAANWTASFNHSQYFPLVGTHATQQCAACHKNGVYKGTPRDCYGCHKAKYDQTTNPNHAAAGFPTTCESCHNPASANWTATFNHNQFFPLLGRHLTAACSSCHKNNVYKGTPRTCYPCHQANYDNTTNPNHRAAGFPTTCEACHTASDNAWTQGRFNHTWFPITSGRHSGLDCVRCHTNPSNYVVFSCLTGCHAKAETDSHHQGRSGYRYDSAACYSCHPNGRAD